MASPPVGASPSSRAARLSLRTLVLCSLLAAGIGAISVTHAGEEGGTESPTWSLDVVAQTDSRAELRPCT